MKKPSLQTQLALVKLVRDLARELTGVAGLLMVVRGVALIYVPAAWIVGGLALAGFAFLLARQAD